MEYKAYTFLNKILWKRKKTKIIISNILYFLWFLIIIIPFPLSVPTWLFLIVIWFLLKLKNARNIKYVIKIKKSLLYLIKNYRRKKIWKKKYRDLKKLYLKSIK